MKQRIEELVNQSKFFANDERRYLERVHNREYSQDEWQDICFEKFANLIIRECVSTLNDMHLWQSVNNQNYPGVWHDAVDQSIDTIKEHFGVK